MRSVVATTPPSTEYALTDLGLELIPAINAIVRVGERLKMGNTGRATTAHK